MAEVRKQPLLSGLLILFLAAMIFANIGGNMYGGSMPLYLKDLGSSIPQIGLFFTISQIVPLFLQILGGWISDTLGRLRAIAIGSVFGVIGFIPLVLAESWGWLVISVAIGSVARALVGPSFDAFIAEHSSEENRGKVFGISQTIFMIVSVVGPPLGGWLAEDYGFKLMLLVAGIRPKLFFSILFLVLLPGGLFYTITTVEGLGAEHKKGLIYQEEEVRP